MSELFTIERYDSREAWLKGRKSMVPRFLKFVAKTDECWLWTGAKNSSGYGSFGIGSRVIAAHRVAYELFTGAIGSSHVLHNCDNRHCVNPSHLFLGTNNDNVADRVAKGRSKGACGEANTKAKLTDAQVREILRLRRSGVSTSQLVSAFDVDRSTIKRIANGKIWRHLDRNVL